MASGVGGVQHNIDFEQPIEDVKKLPLLIGSWLQRLQELKSQRLRVDKGCRASWRYPEVGTKKWKNVRDKYVQELKKIREKFKTGEEGPPPTSSRVYFPLLNFLKFSVIVLYSQSRFFLSLHAHLFLPIMNRNNTFSSSIGVQSIKQRRLRNNL